MEKTTRREISVYADWQGMKTPTAMGTLRSELLRGKEIFSFEYDNAWLQSEYAQVLDPDLQLFSGLHYLNDSEKYNFGLFLDSSSAGARFHLVPFILRVLPDCAVHLSGWNPTDRRHEI